MDFMFDWDGEADRFSFEDSDRFDDDSCSWLSEPESLCNNWRGWKKQNGGQIQGGAEGEKVCSLVELASKGVACHIPFEVVEHFYPPIPEQLQLRIAFWSFPENEEDIRLYSCLANGSADEFQKGDHLYKAKAVKDALQIGFHLSATVIPPQSVGQTKGSFNVAVMFDRRRITSCNCTCNSTASWCAHVVALCLFRIHQATSVCLRAPVSESLSRLQRDQLQKFAQYLISELPQQILPTAQRLLDELLSSQQNAINTVYGAPDPTAGPSASEHTAWCLDETTLRQNIRKTLAKFSLTTNMVYSDVNYLSSTAPPAAAEYQSLLRPLRGREPEGMWNLLSIVREMLRRHDSNAVPLLEILTEEVLACENILAWWFSTKISASHNSSSGHNNRGAGASSSSQHAGSSLCDEIVALWRMAALNPKLSSIQRDDFNIKFKDWHIKTIDKVRKTRGNSAAAGTVGPSVINSGAIKKNDIEIFSGFKPAIEACQLDWTDYHIAGVTYVEKDIMHSMCLQRSITTGGASSNISSAGIHSDQVTRLAVDTQHTSHSLHHQTVEKSSSQGKAVVTTTDFFTGHVKADRAGSSSSEGFSENLKTDLLLNGRDSDSSLPDETATASIRNGMHSLCVDAGAAKDGCSSVNVNAIDRIRADDIDSDGSGPGPSTFKVNDTNPEHPLVEGAQALDVYQSESQQSSDEYQMYFYDPKSRFQDFGKKDKKSDEPNYFAGIRKMDNQQEILFCRAEALYAHGHSFACKLAKQLAEKMLANPPDVCGEQSQQNGKGKKKKHQNNTSSFASTTLAKAAFLCSVLLEDPECHHLAFKVGMFGLEMPRQPAASKALEVKLANQESELVTLLKKIPLGPAELNVIRDRAEQLRDGKLRSRGEALLPLMLASFIFDSLCLPVIPVNGANTSSRPASGNGPMRLPTDEKLGFEAATAALGLKANISEAEHPLLCECTRRQRGDLAIAMLVHYKDDPIKLSKIMDKILDREIHQHYKAPPLHTYLTKSNQRSGSGAGSGHPSSSGGTSSVHCPQPPGGEPMGHFVDDQGRSSSSGRGNGDAAAALANGGDPSSHASTSGNWSSLPMSSGSQRLDYLNLEHTPHTGQNGTQVKGGLVRNYKSGGMDDDSSALEEDEYNCKDWEAKFRSSILKTNKKPSAGMASIDSSAPETTSSDNSPTLVRRNWGKHQGPGSDSGSSGKSSDSIGSSSSGDKGRAKLRDNESPPLMYTRAGPSMLVDSRGLSPSIKGRYKGKNRVVPTLPNQPSEASAHFMNELAKTVLAKAGGTSSTSLFTQPNNNNPTGPHRALHICAFQIGLYALGLHNCVSPNWLSRTYSSHVSWITGQAMEVGSVAIQILIDTWEGHLTPPECALLADKASRGRDPNMVRAAAELALSCLPHAHALNPSEIQRALIQCKEQSREKLEKACNAVELAAKDGGVYPEVLFDVARRWYELYEEAVQEACTALPITEASVVAAEENAMVAVQCNPAQNIERTSPPIPVQVVALSQAGAMAQVPVTLPLHLHYTISSATSPHPHLAHQHHTYVPYVHQVHPHPGFHHHYTQAHVPIHAHTMHPGYLAAYGYQNQQAPPYAGLAHIQNLQPSSTAVYTVQSSTGNHQVQYATNQVVHAVHTRPNQIHPVQSVDTSQYLPTTMTTSGLAAVSQQQQQPPTSAAMQHNSTQMNYSLVAAYRVGMLAMETLGRRVHDDRPQTKYARSPPYGEDVKWLLQLAIKLGTSHLQQFCATTVNAVVSPFVLQDIALEAAHYLARNNPTQVSAQLRSPVLNSLVQKCLQMFIQCAHQRLHHITPNDYDEFVSIICIARNAFCMSPGGMVQFNELLQSLRRAKSCKKELWQRIVSGLATGTIQ
ncbi:zinc finger SWIM domain-containing protein 8 [Lingula anatina]|uniref:Zinc finger SWIM domain-containing protein 8 n=1 Tax=Lingula anatina TaxID=7574 RepID=A0A1S3H4R7_LINAN|nr:zinc finger SWIM domain-containing protein 8 [Lingula anatina]|eukprot:XP_013381125.1 zinc finger SWIM domain-containing protein 8 [Lingula anatina]